ncbi:MAG: DUF3426 domain-containing protein [Rhodocyclaceae bacterium]|nr:DUF3426 domain-containing protein [Rhodocyclaceae bacterium]MDZ4214488.1 DUF3426 domain-containing protein [Rhodocyclaceae bacterium]
MLTRCPHCQTAFRITHEQLIPRQGRVRCGACYLVFSALDSLSDEPTGAAMPVAEVLPEQQEEVVPVALVVPEEALQVLDPEPNPWPFPKPERLTEPEPIPEPEPETIEPEPEPEPEVWDEPEEEAPPRRWPWALGIVLLLLLGAGQLIYQFRVELAVLMPELRAPLTATCEALGCTVPYPHRPELMAIESSDLAPADNERLHLTANLRNRAPFAQAYPHLELTLTDTADAPMLRKVLTPADYLPAAQSGRSAAFFAPRDEVAVSLQLETPGLSAVGYRLYLFYP